MEPRLPPSTASATAGYAWQVIAPRPPVASLRFATPIRRLSRLVLICLGFATDSALHGAPLKVFILAGQSNMEGDARIETINYLGCAKTFAQMGRAFAEANLRLLNVPTLR